MTAQHRIVLPYGQTSPNLLGPCTNSEGWTRLTDGTRGPVQTQRDSIRMLDTNKVERLSLWARKAVALLVIGELVLVIRVLEEPLSCLGHHHLLASTGAFFQVTRGEVSGIGELRPRMGDAWRCRSSTLTVKDRALARIHRWTWMDGVRTVEEE